MRSRRTWDMKPFTWCAEENDFLKRSKPDRMPQPPPSAPLKSRLRHHQKNVSIECASPHESQLVEGLLGHSFLDTLPARLIGDKAYDSNLLDRNLAERYGIEMIAPHRGERREPTQDGRPLRRYRRRWRVERLFTWLHHFRRLVIRWEYHVENFFGMVRLGCMQILLGYL